MTLPSNASLQDVINSLNETQGINAKTELASVIGSPAVASDEVLAQTLKLQTGKTNLRNAIVSKGQTLENNPTFEQMSTAIESMTLAKYATGTVNSSGSNTAFVYLGSTSTASLPSVTVTGLDFKPKIITIVNYNNPNFTVTEYSEFLIGSFVDSCRVYNVNLLSSTNNTNYHMKGNTGAAYVREDSFRLPVLLTGANYTWYARG